MTFTHHLLVVEDDKTISALLAKFLQGQNFAVSCAASLEECQALMQYFKFDLIILDITLPDGSGFTFLKKHIIAIPIIILSALGHVDDRVYGLENGARDYITKPFDPRELLIRIKHLLGSRKDENKFRFGDFTYDIVTTKLYKGEQNIHLTHTEKALLKLFCKSQGKVISREDIAKYFKQMNDRTIDSMISRLRNKLEDDPKAPTYILTERNKGYSFWP